jgi:hypothetical protein
MGRSDVHTAFCSQVYVRTQGSGEVRVHPDANGFEGRASWNAPFDVPVTRKAQALDPGCSYVRADRSRWPLGLTRAVQIPAAPPAGSVVAYFDGYDLRRVG